MGHCGIVRKVTSTKKRNKDTKNYDKDLIKISLRNTVIYCLLKACEKAKHFIMSNFVWFYC